MVVMIITEKPSAAKRIASALDTSGTIQEHTERKVKYYQIKNETDEITVVSALGHLYGITEDSDKGSWTYPIYDYKWAPLYQINKKNTKTQAFIQIIKKLSKSATHFISACDYDMEGSLIAYMILKYAIGANSLKIAERMKFSTLTTSDLIEAYQNRQSALDFSLIEAGQTRHELDWLFGINLTRALTLSLQHVKWNRNIISTGRVQGPALKLLVDREREIRSFVPLPYWIIQAKTQIDKKQYPLVYSIPKVFVQKQAKQIVSECKGKTGTVTDINIKKINLSPPYPFDLGTLQSEAFRVFHFTPKQTLNIAESLYLKALISYPRTSSQKLPKSLQIPQILKQIKIQEKYFALAQKILKLGPRNPQQGIKDDPAHPAIHPTGKPPLRLSSQETKLYDLIVKRFLSTMAEPAQKETIQADLSINIHIFFLKGVKTLFLGWTEIYYPYYTAADIYLPSLHIGDQLPIISISSPKTYTKPPPRYNPGTILRELERLNLGTKATRADIIDRLYQRKYVKEIPAKVSKIGLAVIDVLESYCQDILSSEMTRELEYQMCQIQENKSKRSKVIFNAIQSLETILPKIKNNEQSIGEKLNHAVVDHKQKTEILGLCPQCKTGTLIIKGSRRTGKRFIGCSNYTTDKTGCTNSYPISQQGQITPIHKPCPYCGMPMIKITGIPKRGFRPLITCVNWLQCPGRQSRKPSVNLLR